jgi:hypothetical protein
VSLLPPSKQAWLSVAEVIDALRIFPRIMVAGVYYWIAWFAGWFTHWYEKLPGAERTAEVTAVFGIVIPAVFGLAVWVTKMYLDGGREWDKQKPQEVPQ